MSQRRSTVVTLALLLAGVRAIALAQTPTSLTLIPVTIAGGHFSGAIAHLSAPAPLAGLVVHFTSSNTNVVTVPATITVREGGTTATVAATAVPVAQATTVTITATAGGVSATAQLNVLPPAPHTLAFAPATFVGGQHSVGQVNLTGPATSGGLVVQLSSSHPAVTTLPSTVSISASQAATTFLVQTKPVAQSTLVTITASAAGVSVTGLMSVVPAGPSAFNLAPTTLAGGQSSTGQVSLFLPAASGGAAVQLSSSNTAAATVPASVAVPANATTASFTVTPTPVQQSTTVTITATVSGGSKTAQLNVTPPVLSSVTLAPNVTGGRGATGQVSISGPAPTGYGVGLLSSNTAVASVPSPIAVPAGTTKASFAITSASVTQSTTVTITAMRAGVTKTAQFDVVPAVPIGITVPGVTGGDPSTGQVVLNGPAPAGGLFVQLSSSNTAVATVPVSVTITAGETTGAFRVATVPVRQQTTVNITAAAVEVTRTAQLNVAPPVPSSVTLAPTTVVAGTVVTGQLTLNGPAPAGDLVVQLSSSNTSAATVPPSIAVPAGATTATLKIVTAKVRQPTAVTIAASAGGVTRTAQLTVTP